MAPIITPSSGGRDRRAELLPPAVLPHFDDAFVRSCDLYEEFIDRLIEQLFHELGLARLLETPCTARELSQAAGFDVRRAPAVLEMLLRRLIPRGYVAEESAHAEPPMFVASENAAALRSPHPAAELEELQSQHDASCLPAYRLARAAAASYPSFLRGERTGEELLFSTERIELWENYFSNAHPLYAINNTLAALAIESTGRGEPLKVLELGGGFGSAALALLERLPRHVARYHFTELAPLFLRRGQRAIQACFPGREGLAFGRADINRSLLEQGFAPASFEVVVAVNTLHVAHDLPATLRAVREVLAPRGRLVLSECVRPFAGQPVYVEFIFQLLDAFHSVALDPTLRPNPGFLTPEAWMAVLANAGFTSVDMIPDVRRVREVYPSFVATALVAQH